MSTWLFCLIALLLWSNAAHAGDCYHPGIPDTLNSYAFLEPDSAFHVAATYRANFSSTTEFTSFSVQVPSNLRIYAAPVNSQLSIYLYHGSSLITRSTHGVGSQEVLQASITRAGNYSIQWSYHGWADNQVDQSSCDAVFIEWALLPADTLRDLVGSYPCPEQSNLPSSQLFQDYSTEEPNYHYDDHYVVRVDSESNDTLVIPMSLPDEQGAIWKVKASVGFDFLTGGSLGLAVIGAGQSWTYEGCTLQNNCTFSVGTELNQRLLRASLYGGEYQLVIFGLQRTQTNVESLSCISFALGLLVDLERPALTPVQCPALRLPSSLNGPGYMADDGYLLWSGSVFLPPSGQVLYSMDLISKATSFGRFLVSSDVDALSVGLYSVSESEVETLLVQSAPALVQTEAVALILEEGQHYRVKISRRSQGSDPSACETFEVVLGVVPESAVQIDCNNVPERAPDFSGLVESLVDSPFIYSMDPDPAQPYVYKYHNNIHQQQVFSHQFQVYQASQLYVEVGMDYIVGDVSLYLMENRAGATLKEGLHTGNGVFLFTQLQPGTYALNFGTGVTQETDGLANVDGFPSCLFYTIKLVILPTERVKGCLQYVQLPDSFLSPSFLGQLDFMSLHARFQQPDQSHAILLRVREQSVLRVHISDIPENIHMNVVLRTQGGNDILAMASTVEDGRLLETRLAAYQLMELVIYSTAPVDGHCYPFFLEVEVHPTDNLGGGNEACETADTAPDSDFLSFTGQSRSAVETFHYAPGGADYLLEVPFELSEGANLYMELQQDFLRGNMTASIVVVVGDRRTILTEFTHTTHGMLTAGRYVFSLSKGYSSAQEEWDITCIEYGIALAYDPLDMSASDSVSFNPQVDCLNEVAPASLDTLMYLSYYTDYQTHFQKDLLLPPGTTHTSMAFTVREPSYFHVFTPSYLSQMNATLRLSQPGQPSVNSTADVYGGQAIDLLLQPSSYQLTVLYGELPTAQALSSCPTIPVELELVQERFVTQGACESSRTPPMILTAGFTRAHYQFTRHGAVNTPYSQLITLELHDQASHIHVELHYDFLRGQVGMQLIGRRRRASNSSPPELVVPARYTQNMAFIDTSLVGTGLNYFLQLNDLTPRTSMNSTEQDCVHFDLLYQVNGATDPACQVTEPIPSDLYSPMGGSVLYGGPQDAETGRVRIVARKFPVGATGTSQRIYLKAPVNAELRTFVSSSDATIALTLYKASDEFHPVSSLPGTSVWRLDAQTTDEYFIQVDYLLSPPNVYCSFWALQLEIKPLTAVREELQCPVVYPVPAVPPTEVTLQGDVALLATYAFNDTLLTQPDYIHATQDGGEEFVYTTRLTVEQAGTLHVYVEYSFTSADMSLRLRNASAPEQVIQEGHSSVSVDASSHNFRNVLNVPLSAGAGDYLLDLLQPAGFHPFDMSTYCITLDYSWTYSTNLAPHLMFIDPPGGVGLNPLQDFVVSFVFSEPIGYPSASNVLTVGQVGLEEVSGNRVLVPITVVYGDGNQVLVAVFSSEDIAWGTSYELVYDFSAFQTADGGSFEIEGSLPVYTFQDCDCGGHGVCYEEANQILCHCDIGYAGDHCQNCQEGYHAANLLCVPDAECTDTTCNGHGECKSNHHGYVHCDCDEGWATRGDEWCTICANGYTEQNGDCVRVPDGPTRSPSCDAPLLPLTLDAPGLLWETEKVHFLGDYYLNLAQGSHSITFTLTKDTVVALFVADQYYTATVNAQLYEDERGLVASSRDIGSGQSLYHVASAGHYQLTLIYLPQGAGELSSSCSTMTVELGVRTKDNLVAEAELCQPTMLSAPGLMNYGDDVATIELPGGLHYSEQTDDWNHDETFTFRQSLSDNDRFFYSYSFQVTGTVPTTSQIVVTVDVGSQFILGPIGIVLERETRDHCVSQPANCVPASRFLNRRYLQAALQPSTTYTVWVYREDPEAVLPSLVGCTDYTFSFDVALHARAESEWVCSLPRLPESLSSTHFMREDGSLHLADRFFIPSQAETSLTLTERSLFRFALDSPRPVTVQYKNVEDNAWTTLWSPQGSHQAMSVGAILDAGTYTIQVSSWGLSSAEILSEHFCDATLVEVACEVYEEDEAPVCIHPSTQLPAITPQMLTVPFSFGFAEDERAPQVYTVYWEEETLEDEIFALEFEVSSTIHFVASVESDFLLHNVFVWLESASGNAPIMGRPFYNSNYLDLTLPPDQYVLHVSHDAPFDFVSCAQFTFQMKMEQSSYCDTQGEPLPTTLNSLRFLGGRSNRVNYLSPSVRMPAGRFASASYRSYVPVNVRVPSLLRTYVQPRYGMLPLLTLQRLVGNDTWVDETHADLFGYDKPSAMSALLDVDEDYQLVINYYTTSNQIYRCPTFLLQVSVEPRHPAPALCPGSGGDHFEPSPPSGLPYPTYVYDSESQGEDLYFQQVSRRLVVHHHAFTLVDPANLHFELRFDFHTTDLDLVLERPDGQADVWSTRAWNRAILHILDAPAGEYRLSTRETVITPDGIAGCATFDVTKRIEADTWSLIAQEATLHPSLPETLNRFEYLGFDKSVHLLGDYSFPLGHARSVFFTLEEESYMRVQYSEAPVLALDILHNNQSLSWHARDAPLGLQGATSLALHLQADELYELIFTPTTALTLYRIQLAIEPTARVDAQLEPASPCNTTQWPTISSPVSGEEGFYYASRDLVLSRNMHHVNWNESAVVAQTQFQVEEEVQLITRVGFDFLTNDLSLRLLRGEETVSMATMHLYQGEIDQVLAPGQYTLQLLVAGQEDIPPHCMTYSLVLLLSGEAVRTDCLQYTLCTLPTQLEGSSISYLGGGFQLSPLASHTSVVSLSVQGDALLSVMTMAMETGDSVPHELVCHGSGCASTLVTPLHTLSTDNDRVIQKIYALHTGDSPLQYALTLHDGVAINAPSSQCGAFSLAVEMEPEATAISTYGHCTPEELSEAVLPDHTLVVSSNGLAQQWVESFLPAVLLGSTQQVSFTLDRTEELQVTLGYHALLTRATVELLSAENEQLLSQAHTILPERLSAWTTQALSMSVELPAGHYTLQFTMESAGEEDHPVACFPYSWLVQIYPQVPDVHVENVIPPMQTDLQPGQELTLHVVFSGPLFVNAVPVNSEHANLMQESVYLLSDDQQTTLSPVRVSEQTQGMGSVWAIRFNTSEMVMGASYVLQVDGLHDANSYPVVLLTQHVYSLALECPGQATMDPGHHHCTCPQNYAGANCDECAEGFLHYPSCVPVNYCEHPCVYGTCYDNQCQCDHGWDGPTCAVCAKHFDGPRCDYCERGWAGEDCDHCAPHFQAPECQECEPRFTGEECDECVHPYTGDACDECLPPFTGDKCEACLYPFTGNNCEECVNHWSGPQCQQCYPPFTGTNCSECLFPYTGDDCSECVFPFTGPSCRECVEPFTGSNCSACLPPFTGPDCTECLPRFTGDDCSECAFPFTGPHCLECQAPFTGINCTECLSPYAGPQCEECAFPFTGEDCQECQGHFTGSQCDECARGFQNPATNCTECAPHWTNGCTECESHWTGPNCDVCAGRFTGAECDECVNFWEGDDCSVCPPRFEEESNCATCAFPFRGPKCQECEEGYEGEDCTKAPEPSDVDPIIYGAVLGAAGLVVALLLCVCVVCVVCCMRKRRGRPHKLPVLSLDEEDAIELEENPMLSFTKENEDARQALQHDMDWFNEDPEEFNPKDEVNVKDRYEGALDLDALGSMSSPFELSADDDDFDPRL